MLSLEGDCGKVCPTAVDPDQQRQRHTQPNGMPPTGSPAGAPTVRPGPFRRHARRMTPAMRALRPRVGPLLAIAVLCAAVPVAYAISGLPAGLASQLVSSETTVVDVCTIDSVRGFVVKKSGTLLFWNGTGLSTSLDLLANSLEPLLDSGESGFLSCLATSNTVFTFYTTTKQFALLTKWTFDSATGITNPASEVRLLTFPGVSRTNHNGGAMAWDGTAIVISRGDVASCDAGDSAGCALVQSLDSQWGKILRVDQAGNGLPDNPYWDGNASSVRSTVWAVGQRNPWTMTFDPNNPSDLFIFDVGTRDKECVKRLTKGGQGNYPCLEGTKDMGKCSSMLTPANASVVVYEYDHAGGASIIGGAFMSPSQYGPQFANAVLFGDCSKGILKLAAPGFSSVGPAGSESCPTRIKVAPNGRVWILTLFDGIWV
ncbi:Sorbosone dehydrogenase-domain-containing protein [Hyaloraphidium curvatum]|nr:Sorbosone dehydrogenase-domain-containing protein [Hyaloraphidium curvatum]